MGKFIMNGVPYGGGDVEANPSGTATDTLTKLGIEGTVYEIQGGGSGTGGSSVYSEKVLWENTSGVAQTTVVLNDSILKYDLICIVSSTNADRSYKNQQIIPVSQIDKSGTEYNGVVNLGGNTANNVVITYVDETHLNLSAWASSNPIYYYKIVGLKLGTLSPIIYSTEEREVGVWADNKPLYQKTYVNVNLSNNQDVVIDANVSTMQLKSYDIDFSGTTNTSTKQIGDTSDTLYIDNRGLVYYIYRPGSWWSVLNNANITVWYTKTTDTAGSGSYNTLGIPNVHYDGNEKVVGTYFGETLYERTFTGLATNTNGDNWVNIGGIDASTWDETIDVKLYCNSNDVNNKLTRIALGEARVFNGNVQVTTSVSYNRQINVATIQYTKSS